MNQPYTGPPVYVITDAKPPPREPNPHIEALLPALVTLPFMGLATLFLGALFGWPALVLVVAAIVSAPLWAGLFDLLGAAVGWPPLPWTAGRIAARYRTREGDPHG